MGQYQAAIFDLDGTLLNTLEDLADSANHVLGLHGLPPRTLDEIRRFIGHGVTYLIHRAVPDGTAPELEQTCVTEFRAYYLTNMRHKTAPYPGVIELLETLKKENFLIGVVSNKFDGAVKDLCRHYFGDLLPIAIGESERLRSKPAPDMVEQCLKELGAAPKKTVYVGDSDTDIETAANASLSCISVSWGFRDRAFLEAHGATAVADTPEKLLELLLNG